jgi:hypothetical protein
VIDVGDAIALTKMILSLFLKIYATAAISYIAVAAGYFSWRAWARK